MAKPSEEGVCPGQLDGQPVCLGGGLAQERPARRVRAASGAGSAGGLTEVVTTRPALRKTAAGLYGRPSLISPRVFR